MTPRKRLVALVMAHRRLPLPALSEREAADLLRPSGCGLEVLPLNDRAPTAGTSRARDHQVLDGARNFTD